eukprot:m51a1_g1113 hypothetical protein (275) ;mRNA; r:149478-150812
MASTKAETSVDVPLPTLGAAPRVPRSDPSPDNYERVPSYSSMMPVAMNDFDLSGLTVSGPNGAVYQVVPLQLAQSLLKPRELADPGPLGLLAFGVTVVLWNLPGAKVVSNEGSAALLISVASVYGGLIQIICSIMDFVRNDQFGMIITGTFGAFNVLSALLMVLANLKITAPMDLGSTACLMFIWGVFVFGMTWNAVKMRFHRVSILLNSMVLFNFWLSALGLLIMAEGKTRAGEIICQISSTEGLAVGFLAIYQGMGQFNKWQMFPLPPNKNV